MWMKKKLKKSITEDVNGQKKVPCYVMYIVKKGGCFVF